VRRLTRAAAHQKGRSPEGQRKVSYLENLPLAAVLVSRCSGERPLRLAAPTAVSVSQMRRADELAIKRYGIPALLLMDNAGRCVAEAVRKLKASRKEKIVVLTGGGNNGGDGIAAARYLKGWGYPVDVLWLKNPAEWTGSPALHVAIARRLGVRFKSFSAIAAARRIHELRRAGVIVDALLGTGARGPLRVPFFDAIATINAARRPVVAVDLPSGLDADSGLPLEVAVKARITVTLAAPKMGLLKGSAKPYVGRLVVADIGLPHELLTGTLS